MKNKLILLFASLCIFSSSALSAYAPKPVTSGKSTILFWGVTETTCTTGTCALDATSGNATVTFSSTGVYQINVASGVCSGMLSCQITSTNLHTAKNAGASATAFIFSQYNSSHSAANGSFAYACQCAK